MDTAWKNLADAKAVLDRKKSCLASEELKTKNQLILNPKPCLRFRALLPQPLNANDQLPLSTHLLQIE